MANKTVTEPASTNDLRIGEWRVSPGAGEISKNGETTRLELRAMRLLLCLAERADQVVSIDTLLKQVWGDVAVSPDSVYQVVASLRRQLGDDAKDPMYIETVPKLGYRIVAKVGPWSAETQEVNEVSGIPGERSTGKGAFADQVDCKRDGAVRCGPRRLAFSMDGPS
jgi:transcriptional activator of cad operon